jgi:hypothetical protein
MKNRKKSYLKIITLVPVPEPGTTVSRHKRTLGLITVGAQAVSNGVGTLGKLAGTAVGVAAAAKPLILLGLGKCKGNKNSPIWSQSRIYKCLSCFNRCMHK